MLGFLTNQKFVIGASAFVAGTATGFGVKSYITRGIREEIEEAKKQLSELEEAEKASNNQQ